MPAIPVGLAIAVLLDPGTSWGSGPREIRTNAVSMTGAPRWLTCGRVERVTERVQRFLEWDIRLVKARWHDDEASFSRAHGLKGAGVSTDAGGVLAVAKRDENAIHLGPGVTTENFDGVFGHELAHIIVFQKYKHAIPKWLDEGLANFAARRGRPDYAWLATQPAVDAGALSHPFAAGAGGSRLHYAASTAVMELLASKCRVHELLQLSVGRSLESYLETYCGVRDLNAELARWVRRKAGSGGDARTHGAQ